MPQRTGSSRPHAQYPQQREAVIVSHDEEGVLLNRWPGDQFRHYGVSLIRRKQTPCQANEGRSESKRNHRCRSRAPASPNKHPGDR